MKRYSYIYSKICDIENIKLAIKNASNGKCDRKIVADIVSNINYYSEQVQSILINKTYKPLPYRTFKIKDGSSQKERIIYCPPFFPDQIIHWALMQQISPLIMKSMYIYNCGSVPNRGVHYAKKYLRKWIDTDRKNTKYCLKMDIKKFYPSINKEQLKKAFKNKFKDIDVLNLINIIVDSHECGVPIGNYTSQWFANFFLQGLDYFIKQKLTAKYYIRYMDDMIVLGCNKKKLHQIKREIDEYISPLGLTLKSNWQIFKIDKRDIDFLGFRFFRSKTILRKRNSLRIKRRVKKIYKKPLLSYKDAAAINSYMGWIIHSDSYSYYTKHIKPYLNISKIKEVIANESRK